jgi:glycosyltransferase involved in cell wall biosynthesis
MSEQLKVASLDLSEALFSLIIPVYRSANFVSRTVFRCQEALNNAGRRYEIILVNDGSPDDSWHVIERLALENPEITAVDLVHNYGQHTANYCGFQIARGDYVVTLDDDLQNPPEEIEKLIRKAEEGHDLVVGRFAEKKHDFNRRIGSVVMGYLNRKIFRSPPEFIHTNFRLISRSIVDRMLQFTTHYPYTSGLAIMYAHNPVNVLVDHHERIEGKSNYKFSTLVQLAANIVFAYSKLPMRLISATGLVLSVFSFMLSLFYLLRALFHGTQVQGWLTLVLLVSASMGILFFLLAIIGEYLGRVMLHINQPRHFHIHKITRGDEIQKNEKR